MATKKRKKTARKKEAESKHPSPPEKALVQTNDPDEFWKDERRERCLQMLLRGVSKTQIADELGVNKNTIQAWTHSPLFVKRLREEIEEYTTNTRLRRIRTTGMFNDKVSNLAAKALEKAAKSDDPGVLRNAKEWLSEFRALRSEERADFGDNVQRHQHNVNGQMGLHHSGQIESQASSLPFREFMLKQIESGVVDAEIVGQASNEQEALLEAAQQILIDGELLREFDTEDAALEQREAADE